MLDNEWSFTVSLTLALDLKDAAAVSAVVLEHYLVVMVAVPNDKVYGLNLPAFGI